MIIITGASGFVGKNLSSYLQKKGETVYPLSLRKSNWASKVQFNGKAIIHLAGKAHDTANISDPEDYFKINRDLTINLFDRFLDGNIDDFFYFSSVKAVADTVDEVLVEDYTGEPKTAYGRSKLEAEQYLLSKRIPNGKRLFIIRPCMIHGPGNKGNLNLLYRMVEKGFPWPLASFENKRSFLYIDNLSFLIKEMIDNKHLISGVYNFADDETLSTNELVGLIARVLEKKESLLYLPPFFVRWLARIGDIIPMPLNSERLKKLTESYVVSNIKIKTSLGIEKMPWNVREGLEKTVQAFRVYQ